MLKIENLHYNVLENGKEKEIIKGIDLSFEYGKTYVITGPNGSGKSTFVKIIMGILKQNKGDIFLDNVDLSKLSIDQRAKKGLTFAFQKPVTFKGIKIKELLDIASGKKNNVGQSCEYLANVGLCAKDYIERAFDDSLSGGEQKRIELAMALAKGGKVNIFDEPEAGIDLWSYQNLTKLFSTMNESINIIVSHQQKILELADEVIMFKDGKIERKGCYQEIKEYLKENKCQRLN